MQATGDSKFDFSMFFFGDGAGINTMFKGVLIATRGANFARGMGGQVRILSEEIDG